MSFRLIEQQAPAQGKTVTYTLPLRSKHGPMVLHVEHLGETNPGYHHEAIGRLVAGPPMTAGKRDMSVPALVKTVREARDRKREVVIRHAVRDVENVFHDDGTPATKDDIAAIVHALPDDVFDGLWQFCEEPANFRFIPDLTPSDAAGK